MSTAPLGPVSPGSPSPVPTDRSLLRRLRNGSQDAATQLYLRYAGRLLHLARARCPSDLGRLVDPDDIVQSVFSSFFRGVRKGYYDVPPGEELWKLLLVIALNKIRAQGNHHRAAKRDIRLTSGSEGLEGCAAPVDDSGDVGVTFLHMVIDEALGRWPREQQRMIVLRIEGHEVAEIAALSHRSKRTVERVLQEFRQHLAGLLETEA
jgi:RNA polymerase sigma factor (sigma-70 family)